MLPPLLTPALLAGLVLMLGLVLITQAIQHGRSRRHLQRDLARIFEQLDLLALSTPASTSAATPATGDMDRGSASLREWSAADDQDTIAELIARGADQHELTRRCGVAPAEARILIALRGTKGSPQ